MNQFDGDAQSVFQGRDVSGGVHFHGQRRRSALSQLPLRLPNYVNNDRQLRDLDSLLDGDGDWPRAARILGEPGSGRTALAVQWVHKHLGEFPDGQFFVPLAAGADEAEQEREALRDLLLATGHDPDEIPGSVEGRAAWWRSWTTGKTVAVVVDNGLTVRQIEHLLPGHGRSVVLVTDVGGLELLSNAIRTIVVEIAPMTDDAARELLVRLAGKDRADEDPDAIRRLIEVCDGSTTALCVVAALLAGSSQPAARLVRKLTRDPSAPVRSVFDAAYQRLSPEAQRVYQVLGVHPGTGGVHVAAVAVALQEDEEDTSDALEELVRARLATEADEDRYLMSGLVRSHARHRAERAAHLVERLTGYYWARALRAEAVLTPGRGWRQEIWPDLTVPDGDDDGAAARSWLDAERANLRAVVEAAFAAGELHRVCQLAIALWPLYERGGHTQDMIDVNRCGVEAATALGNDLAAAVLGFQLGLGHRQRAEFDKAAEALEDALERARRSGSETAEASALETLGLVEWDRGHREDAAKLWRENLGRALGLGVPRRIALARFHLAKALLPDAALPLLDQAADGLRSEPYNVTKIDLWRGRKLTEAGRVDEAREVLRAALAVSEAGRAHRERGEIMVALAVLAPDPLPDLRRAAEIFAHHGFTRERADAEERIRSLTAER
ncbi:hypothetical protein GCM10027445_33390 [Amycolatopsis endophytica]|uniref:Tetratricopeptide (TPR) repeat protein n=1 Tax=Amycolatopsis endophytica TaxID=860233 RepID=A0A853B0H9_9PSEU|nr:hypothetical protein [Amycolatopsis endophytica]NYI88402.1 tetratricopeptide (TPR) repeat protein [Amycolatopsis endophytica]